MGRFKTLEDKKYYLRKKALVETRLKAIIAEIEGSEADNYNQALSHTLLAEAKRLRPVLAITVYELFKQDDKILDIACSLELIHAASLMLDDLPSMDDAEYRRGLQTSHLKFGESTAILASAALWLKAFDLIARTDHPEAANLVRQAASFSGSGGVMLGQFYDLESVSKTPDVDKLTEINILKTSSMFRLAVSLGATLGDASKKQKDLLDKFALHLGLAFQIRDDILDVVDTKENTGKDTKKDAENDNPNYVSLIGLDKSYQAFDGELEKSLGYFKQTDLDSKRIESIIEKLKIKRP